MMARCNEGDAAFSSNMHRLLGYLARDVDIGTGISSQINVSLTRTGAPRYRLNLPLPYQQRFATQDVL
jgi:hypothetical protein